MVPGEAAQTVQHVSSDMTSAMTSSSARNRAAPPIRVPRLSKCILLRSARLGSSRLSCGSRRRDPTRERAFTDAENKKVRPRRNLKTRNLKENHSEKFLNSFDSPLNDVGLKMSSMKNFWHPWFLRVGLSLVSGPGRDTESVLRIFSVGISTRKGFALRWASASTMCICMVLPRVHLFSYSKHLEHKRWPNTSFPAPPPVPLDPVLCIYFLN